MRSSTYTLNVTVHANTDEDLPTAVELADGIKEGLHEDWFTLNVGDDHQITTIYGQSRTIPIETVKQHNLGKMLYFEIEHEYEGPPPTAVQVLDRLRFAVSRYQRENDDYPFKIVAIK